MGIRTEWMEATAHVKIGRHPDAEPGDGPTLMLSDGCGLLALTGAPVQLADLATRIMNAVDTAPTRESRLLDLADEVGVGPAWHVDEATFGNPGGEVERFALVEDGRDSNWVSVHPTVEQALHYSAEQECPDDWGPVCIVDLDDGARAPVVRMTVETVGAFA